MNLKLSENKYYNIGIGYILLLVLSIILKNDLLFKLNCGIVLALPVIVILNNDKLLLIITVVFSILSQFLVDEFRFPSVIQYFPDILAIFILIKIINKLIKTKQKINNSILKYIAALLFVQIISFVINDYSIMPFIWGCRNLYRFFIVFVGFQYLSNFKNYSKITKYLKYFVIIQLCISLLQTRIYSDWDNVSGFFGHSGTGLMLINLMFICSFFLANYFYKKMKLGYLLFFIVIIFTEIILGSVKAAFFYLPGIIVIMFFLSPVLKKNYKIKIRNITIMVIVIPLITLIASSLFLKAFSEDAEFTGIGELYSIDYIDKIANSDSYTGDDKSINRLSGVGTINDLVLDNNYKKIFGVGLGNASPNKYSIFEGKYYEKYSELKYNWFLIPYFVMENGFLGMLIFLIILITLLLKSSRILKVVTNDDEKIFIFAYQGCTIAVLVTLIYNIGFSTPQVGYFFWALSGFIISLENKYRKYII